MSFELTEEQAMIGDGLDRLLANHWDRAKSHDPGAKSRMQTEVWRHLADSGLAAALLPESLGGIGTGAGGVLVFASMCGRHGAELGLLSTMMLGASTVDGIESALDASAPSQLAGGELRLALGVLEAEQRYNVSPLSLVASESERGWRLTGHKQHVLDAESADKIVLAARIGADSSAQCRPASDDTELGLFIVDTTMSGLVCTAYPAVGGDKLARVDCQGVDVPKQACFARGRAAERALERALRMARFWAAAETLGACEAAMEQTIEYLRVREQFGRRLASFQALQHRLANMHAELELLRSQVLGSRMAIDRDLMSNESARCVAAASALAAEVGDLIGREAIQLHGAIGMTQDLGVGRYLMRINFLWRLLGDADYQRQVLLASLPAIEGAV